MKCKYTVLSGEEFLDALELAKECVALWDSFTEVLRARDKSSKKDAQKSSASSLSVICQRKIDENSYCYTTARNGL